jgi:predicted nucleotidyltransferase
MRGANEDYTGHLIDQVLVSMQLFIGNTESLLENDTAQTMANQKHWAAARFQLRSGSMTT